jgi:hypothetical protein
MLSAVMAREAHAAWHYLHLEIMHAEDRAAHAIDEIGDGGT